MFKKPNDRTNLKLYCISFVGVNIWNNLDQDLKDCKTLTHFRALFKKNAIQLYIDCKC